MALDADVRDMDTRDMAHWLTRQLRYSSRPATICTELTDTMCDTILHSCKIHIKSIHLYRPHNDAFACEGLSI